METNVYSVGQRVLHTQLGELDEAEAAYRTPLAVDPSFVASHLNLADLYRQQGRDDEGEGEFNWSSQRLDDEVLRCRSGDGEGQTGRIGLRCGRLVGRR